VTARQIRKTPHSTGIGACIEASKLLDCCGSPSTITQLTTPYSAAKVRSSCASLLGDQISVGIAIAVKKSARVVHVGFDEALTKGPPPTGNLAVPIFAHGSLVVELYTPVGNDPQKPHTRDEVYFVARGQGMFFDGERRHEVVAGSFIFVPAGEVHRFEDFSSDFVVWVAFYGPEGGETEV
jgi:mannose-6-phosphate isomerase-like protein (cupin superfamily)